MNFGGYGEDFIFVFSTLAVKKKEMILKKHLSVEKRKIEVLPGEEFEFKQQRELFLEDKTLRKHRISWQGLVQPE